MYEAHIQNPQKVNVWARILNNAIIGLSFIESNLTENYLTMVMLRDKMVPAIQNITQIFNDILVPAR